VKLKLIVLTSLLVAFFCPSIGLATVYYTGPQTFYVRPDPYYQTGQAIGNLLSAMIESSRQKAQAEQEAKRQQELQNLITNIGIKCSKQQRERLISLQNVWKSMELLLPSKGS